MHFVEFEVPKTPASGRTYVELSAAALQSNLALLGTLAGGTPNLMPVVKADAYGIGAQWVAAEVGSRVHSLAVAEVREAAHLRANGWQQPIYLLSPTLPEERSSAVTLGLIPAISCWEEACHFQLLAEKSQKTLPINLVLDTGMGREGFLPKQFEALGPFFNNQTHLALDSISSHFPSSDSDFEFSSRQTAFFCQNLEKLIGYGLRPKCIHLANSAGVLQNLLPGPFWSKIPVVHRVGLGLYGIDPRNSPHSPLKPVLSWHARVSLVRELPADWGVSYGSHYRTARPTLVANLPVGYADGFPRCLSGREAAVLIHGQRCPVLGRVTMDQILVDVSALPEVAVGMQATLLGTQGAESITAWDLASQADTIPWEILTNIGTRVRRYTVG